MNTVFFLDIIEQNGLYIFNRDQELISRLAKSFNAVVPSSDNISTLNDLVISIEDEEPDILLIRLNKNCSQLIISVIKTLVSEFSCRIVLLSDKVKKVGRVSFDEKNCNVISKIDDLFSLEQSENDCSVYKTDNVFDLEMSYGNTYVNTMRNGINSFLSGSYPAANILSNMKHLMVKDPEHMPDLSKMTDILDINSAVIFSKFDPKRFEKLKGFENSIYSHIHQIDGNTIHLDNYNSEMPFKIENYSQSSQNVFSYVKISNSEDISCLKNDIDLFKKSGVIAKLGKRFINECAFGVSACSLSKLFRGFVDTDGSLYPCFECSTPLGSLHDDYFELVKTASKANRIAQTKRSCENCSANNRCSKCAMLPEGISEEEYCDLMQYDGVQDYCIKLALLGMILEGGKVVIDMKQYSEIEISSCYRPLAADREAVEIGHSNPKKVVLLAFRSNKDYYVFTYKSSKLYKTDERFIYIAESFAYGNPDQTIIENYSRKYGLELSEAENHIKEAIQMLNSEVIV